MRRNISLTYSFLSNLFSLILSKTHTLALKSFRILAIFPFHVFYVGLCKSFDFILFGNIKTMFAVCCDYRSSSNFVHFPQWLWTLTLSHLNSFLTVVTSRPQTVISYICNNVIGNQSIRNIEHEACTCNSLSVRVHTNRSHYISVRACKCIRERTRSTFSSLGRNELIASIYYCRNQPADTLIHTSIFFFSSLIEYTRSILSTPNVDKNAFNRIS